MTNIVAFVGHSGSGKTTLVERLVSILAGKGLRVGVIKHTHARIKVDRKGTDTDRFRRAGAAVSAIADDGMLVRFQATGRPGQALADLASEVDLLLVEGYKRLDLPKVLLSDDYRSSGLKGVVATFGKARPAGTKGSVRHFSTSQAGAMAEWMAATFAGKGRGPKVRLAVDGMTIALKPFVAETVAGVVAGLVRPLKGGRGRKAVVSIDFGKKI